MLKLVELLKRGYFPKELPPPFATEAFGSLVERKPHLIPYLCEGPRESHLAKHSLFRAGSLRRILSIPNPISFLRLSKWFEENWATVESECSRSSISLSSPQTSLNGRAVLPTVSFPEQPLHQANLRARSRYILKTDIANFYPSIYTHSIAWALHTKSFAKSNRNTPLLGNELDRMVRDGQRGQSVGIPIGPDTSFVIAEMLLSAVDEEFCTTMAGNGLKPNGYRSYDDFEFGFVTRADADTAISILQKVLSEYELQLNPSKTSVIELPSPLEASWVSELRAFEVNGKSESSLRRYFDRAFEFSKQNSNSEVLKYAIRKLESVDVPKRHWQLCESLLLQCGMVETSSLPDVIDHLHLYQKKGYALNSQRIAEVTNILIASHAPLGHGSEVAWLLWGCLLFGLQIEDGAASAVTSMDDPFAALLLLHARDLGLTRSALNLVNWQPNLTGDGLRESQWLIAYEAKTRGWISSSQDYISNDRPFYILERNGIHFYNANEVTSHEPSLRRNLPRRPWASLRDDGYPGGV